MYGLQMLQLQIVGQPATHEEHHEIKSDYPLGHHAMNLLRIGTKFFEPLDDNVPIDTERQYKN